MQEGGEEGRAERTRYREMKTENRLKAKGPGELEAEGTSCRDPIPGSVGGGPAGSSRGCFRCTPYQPAARCSDPMPMSEKSIVLGQGRGQREPQLHHGEGAGGEAFFRPAGSSSSCGSPGWTTWCGVGRSGTCRGLLLKTESWGLVKAVSLETGNM